MVCMAGDCHVAGKAKRDLNIENVCVANVSFWPRLCEKNRIYSQIGVARKTTPFFLSLSEITVAASKFSARFLS